MKLKVGPEYQRCCKPSHDEVWLSAHVFKTSGVDWDPKFFDFDLQHVDDIHCQVRDGVDRDNPFSTYGESCCGIIATVDQYGEHKHQATRVPYDVSKIFHYSNIRFGFCRDTWYKRHSPLGGETSFNYPISKDNPSKFDPFLWLNEDNPNVKRRMATNNPNEREGKSASNYAMVHDRHLYSKARHNVVEKEEERKTIPENLWLICRVKDIDHEKIHWYKLGRTGLNYKHYKGSTYNVLMKWYNEETTNVAFNVNVADDPVTRTEFSKYQGLQVMIGCIHFCLFWLIGWYKVSSSLNQPKGKTQRKAEADTRMHVVVEIHAPYKYTQSCTTVSHSTRITSGT
jgi:hypothetical protein